MSRVSQPPRPQLQLPFKPFSLEEVITLTGAESRVVNALCGRERRHPFQLCRGEDGSWGLEWMQTFALMVAYRFGYEGCPVHIAVDAGVFVGTLTPDYLEAEFRNGNCFPVPPSQLSRINAPELVRLAGGRGILVPPPDTVAGRRLRIDKMWSEFHHNLKELFPNG